MAKTKRADKLTSGDKVSLFGLVFTVVSSSPDTQYPASMTKVQYDRDITAGGSGVTYYRNAGKVNLAS